MKEKISSTLTNWLKGISNNSPCGESFVDNSNEYAALESTLEATKEGSERKSLKKEVEFFLTKTKDIRLYALYTKIIIHAEKNPLIGLSKGLYLTCHSMENHWDCLYPSIYEDDPSEKFIDRSNALAELANYKDIILPLNKTLNILSIDLGNYTLENLLILNTGGSVANKQPLQGLTSDEEKAYNEVIMYFQYSLELAEKIKMLFYEKTNDTFTDFNKYLLPMLQKGAALGRKMSTNNTTPTDNNDEKQSTPIAPPPIQVQNAINSRKDIIKSLDLICEYYEKNEPSSPVPPMLKRAIRVVNMDYREIFAELQLGADSSLDKVFGVNKK
jgi:type VI secretion system protein ImpA